MHSSKPDLLSKLRTLIGQLGNDGGLVSPSDYDTAQVLRLHPPKVGVSQGLAWLLARQHADGGWGEPTVPAARDVPTLAAVLTLYHYRHECAADEAIQTGLEFLARQAHQWESLQIDLLPIAGEMIIPYLLEEAEKVGLVIDQTPYARIFELRRVKLQYIKGKPLASNSAPTYSWEALGLPHVSSVLHSHTGVGHSPAGTADWLRTAKEVGEDPKLCEQAEAYLRRAGGTTGTGIPGVMPMIYPITGFELCYGLYALMLTGLLNHPQLKDVVAPKIEELRCQFEQEQGLSYGEHFVTDVDDTAVAVAVLQIAEQSPDIEFVRRFWRNDHFYTFAHELNPSIFSNAHALHALVLCGQRNPLTEEFLIRQQTESGAWVVDKWHTSWRSSTLEVIASLLPLGYEPELHRAGQSLTADQNPDGSWGPTNGAPLLETSYSVIALQMLSSNPNLAEAVQPALSRGREWLWSQVDEIDAIERTWLGKELYSAIRVDSAYKLCALLSPLLYATHPLGTSQASQPEWVSFLQEVG